MYVHTYFSLSLSFFSRSLFRIISLSLSLSLSHSHSFYLFLSHSLFICLSLILSLSLYLYLFPSLSLSLSLSLSHVLWMLFVQNQSVVCTVDGIGLGPFLARLAVRHRREFQYVPRGCCVIEQAYLTSKYLCAHFSLSSHRSSALPCLVCVCVCVCVSYCFLHGVPC